MKTRIILFTALACLVLLSLSGYADTHSGLMLLNLDTVEEEAFCGDISLKEVEIPESTKKIESRAFADCVNLSVFYCYSRDVAIAEDAFENTPNVRMYCFLGSTMDTNAKQKGISTSYFDAFEIECNTEKNGCKGLPITWTLTDILPGEKVESVYSYRILKDGAEAETFSEQAEAKFVYTPSSSGNYQIEVTMKNELTETTMVSEEVPVADKLYMGIYEQDADASTQDPLEWIILTANEEKAFVLSKYILKTDSFFNPAWIKYKYCNWNGSLITIHKKSNNWYPSADYMGFKQIDGVWMVPKRDRETYISNEDLTKLYHCRTWCNGTFYSSAFTDEEKERILLTHNINPENPSYSSIDGGPDTYDYVFFLSYDELTKYLPDAEARKTANTTVASGELGKGKPVYWWLRTRGVNNVNVSVVYASGTYNGKVWMTGTDVGHDNVGYRPAMWITVGG
ncbi:MAG: leucine-rich repeat protein [Clostridia bacterium]|nr:leucine-rich repeat protein [Clostridia bacterium]